MSRAAEKIWRDACSFLQAPTTEECWRIVLDNSPSDTLWHSLNNCVSQQAQTWLDLLSSGILDVTQPAAFKLAIILRHTPLNHIVHILDELLGNHPQSQDLTSYVMALLNDDEGTEPDPNSPPCPAPLRDLQLYGDSELAVLAADWDDYNKHARLVKAEYSNMPGRNYLELRIKVLEQFSQIPQLYHTPEFSRFEKKARENIANEIKQLREELNERE